MCHEENCCCCFGPQGPQGVDGLQGPQGIQGTPGLNGNDGPQGPAGIQGVQGPAGPNGNNGVAGSVGPQGVPGIQGAQGVQGIQGIPGKDCEKDDKCCERWYVSVYSLTAQALAPNASPFLELVSSLSSPLDFDISTTPTNGEIKVLKHGVYTLAWGFDGILSNPFPFPVPSWSLGIYRNGSLLPGSSSASCSISPDQIVTHASANLIIEFFAGDVLKLVNLAVVPINSVTVPFGSSVPTVASSININLVKPLP